MLSAETYTCAMNNCTAKHHACPKCDKVFLSHSKVGVKEA